jgi:hypothetical protein
MPLKQFVEAFRDILKFIPILRVFDHFFDEKALPNG